MSECLGGTPYWQTLGLCIEGTVATGSSLRRLIAVVPFSISWSVVMRTGSTSVLLGRGMGHLEERIMRLGFAGVTATKTALLAGLCVAGTGMAGIWPWGTIGTAACLVGSMAVAWSIVRSATLPVRKIRSVVAGFNDGNGGHRLDLTSPPGLGPFADEFNTWLESYEQHMARGRQCRQNLTNLPTPVMTIDPDYTVTFLNSAGAGALGKTPEECVGQKCYDLFKTPHCGTPECRCNQAMNQDGIFSGETIADPDGLNLPISYTGAPIKDQNGNVVGAPRIRRRYQRDEESHGRGPDGGRESEEPADASDDD